MWGTTGQKLWQTSFYDHVIRDEADYLTKWNYIAANPAKWAEDEYYQGKELRTWAFLRRFWPG